MKTHNQKISLYLENDLKKHLKIVAENLNVPLSSLISEVLERFVLHYEECALPCDKEKEWFSVE